MLMCVCGEEKKKSNELNSGGSGIKTACKEKTPVCFKVDFPLNPTCGDERLSDYDSNRSSHSFVHFSDVLHVLYVHFDVHSLNKRDLQLCPTDTSQTS